MRFLVIFAAIVLLLLFTPKVAFAQSDYVLPYPPVMPGGIMYKIRLIHEEFQKYWYFGNLSQFTYNLKQSDKYLVEAKTLFEYKQYLLAYQSLEKSTVYFKKIQPSLLQAIKEGKDVSEKEALLKRAAQKHTEILNILLTQVPSDSVWNSETGEEKRLLIHELLKTAITARQAGYE